MIITNYKIESLEFLLDESCLPERYFPLVAIKESVIKGLKGLKIKTKDEIAEVSDEELSKIGFKNIDLVHLFRRFLTIYDFKDSKARELKNLDLSNEEREAFEELFLLPGVKSVRASLYFKSGYKSLKDIATSSLEEILERTARTIKENELTCIVPLPKEVRTHIAVAKALLL